MGRSHAASLQRHKKSANQKIGASENIAPDAHATAGGLAWRFFLEVGLDMGTEAGDDFVFVAFVEFLLDFFESKVDDVVVVHFEWGEAVAEA